MRKTQKNKAEELINLLDRARGAVKKAVETKNYSIITDLFEQCQDIVIGLRGLIEASEGEGFKTISMLEDHCELVYRILEEIAGRQIASADKIFKNLRKSLIQIKTAYKATLMYELKLCFFLNKASMWNSLENIWKAAKEAPDCDAYVILIPYYDKNPDGSFRVVHYEGDLYPDDVPIAGYNDYDFEARKLDTIYIHNSYDVCNHATSVHSFLTARI